MSSVCQRNPDDIIRNRAACRQDEINSAPPIDTREHEVRYSSRMEAGQRYETVDRSELDDATAAVVSRSTSRPRPRYSPMLDGLFGYFRKRKFKGRKSSP